jgi:hypothetical protein
MWEATERQFAVEQVGERVDPVRQQVEDLWNADSIRLAERILTEAGDQAAEIVTTAEHKAAEITQSAADRAAATVTTAEREAAEMRAATTKMTVELGRVAAYVVENLAVSTEPATKPGDPPAAKLATPPVTEPQARPTTKTASRPQRDATENLIKPARPARSATRPAARPGISPRRTPAARPAAKPKARQVGAWRKMVAALAVLFLVGITSAATEIGLHGFSFFVFRNTGAGAGNPHNLDEDQGPGQPDAPGTHHKAKASKPAGNTGINSRKSK